MDADVLFAGAASPNEHSANNLILRMAELTFIEAVTSEQVVAEVECNLVEKLPGALPAMQLLISRSLKIVENPGPYEVANYANLAHVEDLPILVAAVREGCSLLTTFNLRHYQPGHPGVTVLKPGDLVLQVRYLLARLGS